MFAFMFAVLGSVFFWGGYGALSLVMTVLLLRTLDSKVLKEIITGKHQSGWREGKRIEDWSEHVMVVLLYLIFWPITLAWKAVWFFIKWCIFKSIAKLLISINNAIPEFKVVRKEGD